MGRIHMEKQDLADLQLRKVRALRKTPTTGEEKTTENGASDGDDDGPQEKRARADEDTMEAGGDSD